MKMTKKVLSILLSFILVLGAVAVGGMSASADGDGIVFNAVDNRYEISDYEGLKEFAAKVNGGETAACAKLMKDIDASASAEANDWTPIGNNSKQYTGTFDGLGHTITGLTYNNPNQSYAGLFGYVGEGGKVRDVGLEGGSITGNNYAGGVIGLIYGTVTNCYNTGNVSGNDRVGGVAGYNRGTITNCYNTGAVSGAGNYVGGVVGINIDYSSVENCYNTGAVSCVYDVGGVVGHNVNNSSVENCYNTGSVSGNVYVGGVVGENYYNSSVKNCYYDSVRVTGISAIGEEDRATHSNVAGLTTAQMTGESALDNMVFEYGAGDVSPWMAKASDDNCLYYPHLKGFNINDYGAQLSAEEIDPENWPAKKEQTKADPVITLSVPEETQVEGEELTITVGLPEDATGTVTLAIGDEEGTAAVSGDGTAEIKIAATPGTHEILVSYSGDDNYNMVSENRIVKIPKYLTAMKLKISPEEPVPGEDITVTAFLPDGATKDVTLTVDGIDYTVPVEDGRAVLTVENPATGEHTVTASYPGDDNYTEASAEISFAVNKVTPEVTVTVSPEEPVYGDKVTVTVNYPADATVWSEIPLPPGGMNPGGMITIKLDGYELTTVDGSEGVFVYELPAVFFGAGGHTVKIIFNGDDKYSSRAVETAFTVTKKDVTITANNQELIYNGLTQGEGDTVYEDPDLIAQKVTAATLADGDYISKITLDGQAQDPGIHEGEIVPSNAVIMNAAGEDVSSNYNISYSNGDLIIKTTSVPLTINYIYEGGNEAAPAYRDSIALYTNYSVESPEIANYTPDIATVEGTMGDEDMGGKTVTVTYTPVEFTATFVDEKGETVEEVKFTVEDDSIDEPAVPEKEGYEGKWSAYTLAAADITIPAEYTAIEYTATFIVDGETVEEVRFTVEDDSIDEPAVPEKEGYEGSWTAYTLTAADITIPAEYTAIEYNATFVDENGETVDEVKFTVETEKLDEPAVPEKTNYNGEWEEYTLGAKDLTIKPVYTLAGETVVKTDSESEITTDYKESKRYAFEPEFVPEGATAHVFYNGEDRGEGTSIEVKEPTDDYTVECKVLDENGNEIATSGEIKVKVKNSFFDRLRWFFNNFWANILKTFIEALIKAC